MTTTDKASPRDRLLDAAAQLVYREGVSVGVEALCRAAGVSKRSMYQLFGGKDEMLAASLERQIPWYEARLAPADPDSGTPRERILHVFEQVEKASADPGYLGCPYLAVLVELKDPGHPASEVARTVKARLEHGLRTQAELGGARDPGLLARQLMLVFDGASARAGARVEHLDDGLTTTTVTALLDAAGMR
ncbi:TetR/AcrR family transcriptional regulator [Streptomyces collinus]|uniref:TetR family transcriptional regulator n=1 Tax=Streptomyces collinus (strain DSM 40733 / Tue 365) TaxID=1214242 RepID=S5VRC8_STRC3|nr:TetR/AcrR family transcriptional regulator [Streptomyces collinus]AGS73247.1 TetR family transcriptional regulator [Streptomyces collinus Tu 365]UJA11913.1 TetR/AcrR family transcriptional regulator [Streptomyces collinus]UJA13221.1 TetR/AcrR family transcriptional regulator [Streptomyces collinus]